MFRKTVIVMTSFAFAAVLVLGVGAAARGTNPLPKAVEPDSPCPVTACASGTCHGYADVPVPDGVHEMQCPKNDCSSVQCHAWDTLENRYSQASDASMNIWILAPVVLALGTFVVMTVL